MKTFSLRELLLVISIVCVGLGSYSAGSRRAERQWHLHGFAEAEDHYQVMLSSYAERKDLWDYIGDLWRKNPDMIIIGSPLENEEQWKLYVQYHAQRNGWKDPGVFKRLEDDARRYRQSVAKENGWPQ